jgi:hypothetical protein
MRFLAAAAGLLFAFPGAAFAARTSLVARELPVRGDAVERAPQRFELVGLHWQGPGAVLFRTRSVGGRWGRWRSAESEAQDGPDRASDEARRSRGWRLGSPYWVGASDRIQYRFAGRVLRLRGYFVRSTGRPVRTRPLYLAGSPPIVTRHAWHANEAIRRGTPLYAPTLKFAVVHHTAGSNDYGPSQSAAIVRAIEAYHVLGNGWNDIGYNFLIDRYGQVFEGRYGGVDRPVVGAHAMGFNYESVGVALIGTYTSTAPTPAQERALVKLLAWRLDVAHVDPRSYVRATSTGNPRYPPGTVVTLRAISGHRDTGPTECPGNIAYAELPAITRAVAATGLPKIYAPQVRGGLGGKVRFTARLSAPLPWTVTVTDALQRPVATGAGTGTFVDWTWDASAIVGGSYAYTISAGPDARPATGSIGRPVPQLSVKDLAISPEIVTPNGDGRGDSAHVTYVLGAPGTVTGTLTDANGAALATLFNGFHGSGRQSFTWADVAVPDGRYRILVSVRNDAGLTVSAAIPVVVDRTLAGFTASPRAISPNGDGRADSTQLSFRLAAAADVKVAVMRAGRLVATIFSGRLQPGAQQMAWGGSGLRDGRYTAVVTATDPLATLSEGARVVIDTRPPVLRMLSLRRLLFSVSEWANVTVDVDGQRIVRTVPPGRFAIPHHGAVQQLIAVAVDEAGNQSKTIRRP